MFYTFGKPPTGGVPLGVSSKKPFSSAASAPSRRWCSCSCGIHGGWIGWTHKKPLNSWLYEFLAGMDLNTQCLRWKLLDCSIKIELRFRAQMCPNSRLAACWGLLMWNSYTCKIFVCSFFRSQSAVQTAGPIMMEILQWSEGKWVFHHQLNCSC